MSTSLLVTKLFIPPLRPNAVTRTRLLARLNADDQRKLTLVSAPAGFGKTSLLSAWAKSGTRATAWLTLDERDSDPVRFLSHVVGTLRSVVPGFGIEVESALQAPLPPTTEVWLTALLNEISSFQGKITLVLDDYHLVDSDSVDRAVDFLLDHMPSQLHLAIATRQDPAISLSRLRTRGQMTELRAGELRFTASEAADFLNQSMGLNLSEADVSILEDRTEGWVAGLQLAALSLQGHQDVSGFIRAFAGDHRYIVDYLVDEVLRLQSEPDRRFLLQTSILERLTASLCDAVTSQTDGAARLEAFERGNFFVVPLDEQRRWYRYHRLFADVLFARLLAEQPEQVATLRIRASVWYEEQGLFADAIRHALAATDFPRAAGVIELAWPALRQSRQESVLLGWLTQLPDELVRARPVLGASYAWALLMRGDLDGVELRLRDVEHWLDFVACAGERPRSDDLEMVVVNEAEFRQIPGLIALFRAAQSRMLGDVDGTLTHARRVLDLASDDDDLLRGSAAGLLGLAYWTRGDLQAAHRAYVDCMTTVLEAGHVSDALGCTVAVSDLLMTQGRLREALSTCEEGLQLATRAGAPVLRGAVDMHVALSNLLRERNEMDAATWHLQRSKELGDHMGLPQTPYRRCVGMARIKEAQGDLEGALDLLDEAQRRYDGDFFPNVHPIAAQKARLLVLQGRVDEALGWARQQGLSAQDDLSYLREFEHLTLARALLADGSLHSTAEAIGLLERLLAAAEAGGRVQSIIAILALQSAALLSRGDISVALVPLERALRLGESEGYVRIFVDEGPAMETLLGKVAKRGLFPHYVARLLKAFSQIAGTVPDQTGLIEPLSERELDVLRLLRTDLSGPEIANELLVSLNTMRTHTKNIYTKLGVNNRRAAVRRAYDLSLFSSNREQQARPNSGTFPN